MAQTAPAWLDLGDMMMDALNRVVGSRGVDSVLTCIPLDALQIQRFKVRPNRACSRSVAATISCTLHVSDNFTQHMYIGV